MGWMLPQTGKSLEATPLPPIGGGGGGANQTYPNLDHLSGEDEEEAGKDDKIDDDPKVEVVAAAEEEEPTMRGGLFLVLYTVSNVAILFLCTAYIVVTKRDLSTEADDALVIPQILAVIPGARAR